VSRKRKIPEINKKDFPYPLVRIYWEDFSFEDNGDIKQGGGYTTIPTKNVLAIKKIKI
jgi:hypothetical protein